MKKYILIIILIMSCLILSGCGKTTTKENYLGYEQEHELKYGRYAIIKDYYENGHNYLTYDIETKIMYQIIVNDYRLGISEYYINKNNKPEIGIYGYNYKGE